MILAYAVQMILYLGLSLSIQSSDRLIYLGSEPGFKMERGSLFYNDKLFRGAYLEYYKNGKLKTFNQFRLGKKHGTQKRYFASGQPLWLEFYQLGKRDGSQYGWHRNGKARFRTHYVNGKKDGDQWAWYENGRPASFTQIVDEHEVAHKKWRPNGLIFSNYISRGDTNVGFEGGNLCKSKY